MSKDNKINFNANDLSFLEDVDVSSSTLNASEFVDMSSDEDIIDVDVLEGLSEVVDIQQEQQNEVGVPFLIENEDRKSVV